MTRDGARWREMTRGGPRLGPDRVHTFLERNDLDLIVRAHQAPRQAGGSCRAATGA